MCVCWEMSVINVSFESARASLSAGDAGLISSSVGCGRNKIIKEALSPCIKSADHRWCQGPRPGGLQWCLYHHLLPILALNSWLSFCLSPLSTGFVGLSPSTQLLPRICRIHKTQGEGVKGLPFSLLSGVALLLIVWSCSSGRKILDWLNCCLPQN